jgi:hypothetical protein
VGRTPAAVAPSTAFQRGRGRHPHVTINNAHYTQRHVVRPQVEGRPAAQVETGMVPVAGENAILDAAAVERKSHVRAAVVERDHVLAIGHDKHSATGSTDHHAASVANFAEPAHPNEASVRTRHAIAHSAIMRHTCAANNIRLSEPFAACLMCSGRLFRPRCWPVFGSMSNPNLVAITTC